MLETFDTNPVADEVDAYYAPGTRNERRRETHVAQLQFALRDRVPNAFVRVNPLGLQVAYFRVDQAFEERAR